MSLTPEERQRIYEEEKERLAAQKRLKQEEQAKQIQSLLIVCAVLVGLVAVFTYGCSRSNAPQGSEPPNRPLSTPTATVPTLHKACNDFTYDFNTQPAVLRNLVSKIGCSGGSGLYRLTLTVRDMVPAGLGWLSLTRTERLEFTKTMWKLWVHYADREHPDSDYIHIESEAGEDLGGSGFAGSLINVKGGQQ